MRFEGTQSQSLMMVLQVAQVSCKGIHGNLSRFQGIMITSQPGVYRVISRVSYRVVAWRFWGHFDFRL